eukprot:4531826-Amphidinium_carterae.1
MDQHDLRQLRLWTQGLGITRKVRIVACSNFVGQYETYDVSNLDVVVFRAVLQMASKRRHRRRLFTCGDRARARGDS